MTVDSPPAPAADGRPLERYERFMRTVRAACATPRGRAVLQQALADEFESTWQMYTVLLPAGGIPSFRADRDAEHPFLLVAALYALHDAPNPRMTPRQPAATPQPADARKNLGWSYARAVASGAMRAQIAADHVSALAMLDLDALYRQLPGAISLLRSQKIPVHWPVLLRDLTRWPQWADDVRIEWVRAFHAPTTAALNEENPA